jgi:hypothetical protein
MTIGAIILALVSFAIGRAIGMAEGRKQVNREAVTAAIIAEMAEVRAIPFPDLKS